MRRLAGVELQKAVAKIALGHIAGSGFALAGSGAIREHGVIDRPTEDIDLFTTNQDTKAFGAAVDQVVSGLRKAGFEVQETRRAPQFARLDVRAADGLGMDLDLGEDWREQEPTHHTSRRGPLRRDGPSAGRRR